MNPDDLYEIEDADGWTGVTAESIEGIRLGCETIANEGYVLPFHVYRDGRLIAVYQQEIEGCAPVFRCCERGKAA